MTEPFDLYSDAFTITISPWGANLSFQLHEAHPAPATVNQPTRLGTIRMSNEHMKAMVFMLRRQILQHEAGNGVQCDVPTGVLSQLGIPREDWDAFWAQIGGLQ